MRALILCLVSLITATAAAADIAYSVYNVRPGDTLNMRLQPNPGAPVVQAIPHDGVGIMLTGRNAAGGWVEAFWRRKRGWVNGRFLGIGGAGRFQLPAFLDCLGTEPFWSIGLAPGYARAELMFAERRFSFRLTGAQNAMARPNIWHIRASARPRGEMSLIIQNQSCSDGMSDNSYPYAVVALIRGYNPIAGCCRPAPPR